MLLPYSESAFISMSTLLTDVFENTEYVINNSILKGTGIQAKEGSKKIGGLFCNLSALLFC